MLRTLLLFIALLPVFAKAQEASINWMTIEEAQEAQKKNPKKIMMDVYTKWCGPCKMVAPILEELKEEFTN